MTLSVRSNMPMCFPQFSHIKRYVDKRENTVCLAKIKPGEYYVTNKDEVITTVLGSCIAVCVYDVEKNIGGMNHFMLPEGSDVLGQSGASNTRYGMFAMEKLINDILINGGRRSDLKFKIFGGANILPGASNIGGKNALFIKRYLKDEGFYWNSEDLGKDYPREVKFYPMSGKVLIKKIPKSLCNDVIIDELNLKKSTQCSVKESGDLELF